MDFLFCFDCTDLRLCVHLQCNHLGYLKRGPRVDWEKENLVYISILWSNNCWTYSWNCNWQLFNPPCGNHYYNTDYWVLSAASYSALGKSKRFFSKIPYKIIISKRISKDLSCWPFPIGLLGATKSRGYRLIL